jgi:hypothetical protein
LKEKFYFPGFQRVKGESPGSSASRTDRREVTIEEAVSSDDESQVPLLERVSLALTLSRPAHGAVHFSALRFAARSPAAARKYLLGVLDGPTRSRALTLLVLENLWLHINEPQLSQRTRKAWLELR